MNELNIFVNIAMGDSGVSDVCGRAVEARDDVRGLVSGTSNGAHICWCYVTS